MRKVLAFLAVLFVIAYFSVYISFLNTSAFKVMEEIPVERNLENPLYKEKEDAVFGFVQEHMLGMDGEIFTQIKVTKEGLQTLSESVGLLMNYCVLRDKKELFDREFSYLQKHLLVDGRYVRWLDGNMEANCNAAVDDFRIIRALLDGYDKWKEPAYLDTAKTIGDTIFDKQVSNEKLYEFYDWKQGQPRKVIPLCYLDFHTIGRLQGMNPGWRKVYEEGMATVQKGRLEKHPALFMKYYNHQTGRYSQDEEYAKGKRICLTYTLYTALHLAEVGQDTQPLTGWLKEEMEKGKLYGWYNPDTLQPVTGIQSTAVYAIAAMYAKQKGEEELYKKLVDKMLEFMVEEENSVFYGGFGVEETLEFYSFDNLTALWALALGNR